MAWQSLLPLAQAKVTKTARPPHLITEAPMQATGFLAFSQKPAWIALEMIGAVVPNKTLGC